MTGRVGPKVLKELRSQAFFKAVLVLFFLESAWVAFSAAYPMVFDENVHFTVIQLYAHQWSPIVPVHSMYVEPFGALSADPSVLYRYLMSFPYRLVAAATGSLAVQVVFLRLVNVVLFGAALVLFRRLLLKTKASSAAVNIALLFFVLLPVVPLLAGQINYDNMVVLATALALLLAVSAGEKLAAGKLPAAGIFWLATVCLLGGLVQFAFMPVFAAIFLWLAWRLVQLARAGRLLGGAKAAWQRSSWQQKLVVGLPFVLALALFMAVYGGNVVRYHALLPACDHVLSRQQCAGSGAWVRAQEALAHKQPVNANPIIFGFSWTYRMFVGLFFTSSGGAGPQAWYLSVNPLPAPFITALVTFAAGILLLIRYWRTVFEGYNHLGFLLYVALFCAGMLLLRNYQEYLHLGQKFAINGRYLLPVVPILIIVIVLAFARLLGSQNRLKLGFAAVVLLLFLQGGGALTYMAVSNSGWYWHNGTVVRLNRAAQAVVRPLIVFKKPLPPLSGV